MHGQTTNGSGNVAGGDAAARPYISGNRLALYVPGRGALQIVELTDRYAIAAPSTSSPPADRVIFCRACVIVSHNLNDVEHRYCGKCHRFLGKAVTP
jgi:hypothetical protein